MTTTTGSTRTRSQADRGRTTYVLLNDDLGRLMLARLRPWHRMLARSRAARLDRVLAGGASPETSVSLAARAVRLTSVQFRRDLAASVQRILVAARQPPTLMPSPAAAARPPRIPLRREQISRSASQLAELAARLAGPGPLPVQGVAMVSRLLADGTGPLYHDARHGELGALIEEATRALIL